MPAVPRVDLRRYLTKGDLAKYGYTDECEACTQLATDMRNGRLSHNDRRRDRIGELMTEDDDRRQGERVSSRAVPEAGVPRPEAAKEMDVSAPTVRVDSPPARPAPTYQEGWILRFGFESERMNTDERDAKPVKLAESQGQRGKEKI